MFKADPFQMHGRGGLEVNQNVVRNGGRGGDVQKRGRGDGVSVKKDVFCSYFHVILDRSALTISYLWGQKNKAI